MLAETIVFYHENCTDGFGAAYVAYSYFKDHAIYIPVNYNPISKMQPQEALDYLFMNHDIEIDQYKQYNVYVLDYAFPVEHFKYHATVFRKVIVLDHHKTSHEAYKNELSLNRDFKSMKYSENCFHYGERSYAMFLNQHSGAKLAYLHFYGDIVPLGIELISDRDLWTFEYGEKTKAFYLYLQSLIPWDFTKWDFIYDDNLVKEKIKIGRSLLESRNYKIKSLAKNQFDVKIVIDGKVHCGKAVNASSEYASDLGSYICQEGNPFCIIFTITSDKKVSCSIRSQEEIDVEMIAKYFGGGGHKNSSGFNLDLNTFCSILDVKGVD